MNNSEFRGWAAYSESVVDVFLGERTVTLAAEGILTGDGWRPDGPAYVITAYNPGRATSSTANEAAQARLLALLAEREITWIKAIGRSRDGSWQEPSVVVLGISEGEAMQIARAFQQDAIFSWDGQRLRVLDCRADRK